MPNLGSKETYGLANGNTGIEILGETFNFPQYQFPVQNYGS